jgi:hypothetical protein
MIIRGGALSFALFALFVLAGCDRVDPYKREGMWRPTSANDANLRAMVTRPSDLVAASRMTRRVGTEDYSSVPLTEPYVRVTHTAPWIDRSDPSTSWADTGGSRVASVTPATEPVVFLFLALCGRRLRRPDASGGSVVPPPEGLSANARPNCRGPVFLNPSLPSLRRLSPVSPLL